MRTLLVAFLAAATAALAAAPEPRTREDCERIAGYSPASGQKGKDVVWVPTNDEVVATMLRMARVGPGDFLVDLGAGDGKIAIAAARQFGARALGIEYNPDMVRFAQCLVKASRAGERASVIEGDIFKVDFSRADVVTMYLLPDLNLCIRHRVLAMRPGVRVVSHNYPMGEWEADASTITEDYSAYLWVVPARVGGTWSFRQADGGGAPFEVRLGQAFQKITGEASLGQGRHPLAEAALRGDELRFAFHDAKGVRQEFAGRASGREITGTLRSAAGSSVRVAGSLRGDPQPAPWADMTADCERFYAS
jgi:SAM-dependent methyltransferase